MLSSESANIAEVVIDKGNSAGLAPLPSRVDPVAPMISTRTTDILHNLHLPFFPNTDSSLDVTKSPLLTMTHM